ncbi:MAG: hypothetical protein ABIX01_22520 [Chitinophagaceae bacterium]
MDWKNLIPEIQEFKKDHRTKRGIAKKAFIKYKRGLEKFYFLDVITMPKVAGREEDDLLEVAVRDLFKSIGFNSKIPADKANFDVIAKFKELAYYIEVKNGNMPSENDMLQAFKYAGRQGVIKNRILIWNNFKSDQEFDQNRIMDAEINNYGIMTTKELYNGYLKLKAGKISFEKFTLQLQKTGLIKFSSRALKEDL